MAEVVVDEGQLKALQGAHKLLDTLMRDPATRPAQERLIKHKFPNVTTSEDDPRVKEMRELAGKVNKFMEDQQNEKIQGHLDSKFSKLRAERDYTDEGIERIKKYMVEHSIPDPEDAADLWEKRNPAKPQEPANYLPQDWGFNPQTDDEDLKALWRDDDTWLNKEIGRTLRDFRKGLIED